MQFSKGLLLSLAGVALAVSHVAASGQTLAHKGWVGSGITVEPWWTGAVLYQIDPASFEDTKGDGLGDLHGVTQKLDYLQSLSVDAIVLSPFQLQADFGRNNKGPALDPKYGTEEDLDHLIQEAGRRKIRVFVDLPLVPSRTTAEVVNIARFWLSRGVAGLRLTSDVHSASLLLPQIVERLRELRKLCGTFAGQRVVFWDVAEPVPHLTDLGGSSSRRSRHTVVSAVADGPQMVLDNHLVGMTVFDAGALRGALQLEASQPPADGSTPVPVTEATGHPRSFDRFGDGSSAVEMAKVMATVLLTSRGAPLLYDGQEIGTATTPAEASGAPPVDVATEDSDAASLLNWYRKLSALHHQNDALRVGSMDLIAESNPDIVAWVRRSRDSGSLTAPVVVVCNVTGRPLLVSVVADVRRVGVETSTTFMHTLASTALTGSTAAPGSVAKEPVFGPVSMNAISLPPYGVYIGELPRPSGLESVPLPAGRRSR